MSHPLAFLIAVLLAGAVPSASAHVVSPRGIWRSIDDRSGEARLVVRVFAENDEVKGTVEKVLADDASAQRCEKCEGRLRNQPVLGMLLLWGFRYKDGDYKGGQLVDPDDGKIYRCTMRVADDGSKLMIRGFPGLSFSARSWTFVREGEQPVDVLPPSREQ